ncbi:MAG: SIR2 family protein [Gammaproteobacteria bacterium]|nr:SIR2 family protein [Gammaproteobacteria bacterium]
MTNVESESNPSPFEDPTIKLAFSIYENPRVFTLLLGSGVSKSAGIPTGWDITLDLIRRVARINGIKGELDWESWYKDATGKEPNYSDLMSDLALESEERRSLIDSYIEPTQEDGEDGQKVPTITHYAIADLVKLGYIRVIITTNFDRLLENALHSRGIEPTIISSVDALAGATPIIHTDCTLIKLHGDYKDTRILNTESELTSYPEEYESLLDRIFEDHGLIVCGWSGDWDNALRSAIVRNTTRRYSAFWTSRGKLRESGSEVVKHLNASLIQIDDADSFFQKLLVYVRTLDEAQKMDQKSLDLLLKTTKRFLGKSEYRINLGDFLDAQTSTFLERIDVENLEAHVEQTKEEFNRRVKVYEEVAEPLSKIVGVLGRWGDDSEFSTVVNIVGTTYARAKNEGTGSILWIEMKLYPTVLLVAAYGIGLARAERWETLHKFLQEEILDQNRGKACAIVDSLFLFSWEGGGNQYWRSLEGFENRKTALSDHLHDVFQLWSNNFIGVVPDFEEIYQAWEIFGALSYSSRFEIEQLRESPFMWIPIGRSSWNTNVSKRIWDKFQKENFRKQLLALGFGNGNDQWLDEAANNFQRISSKVAFS